MQLSVLLIHAGWWGVAPSPTDEGALRTGHGEHGEPGHQEPHKDSYSTFASEFLESRYLSDDGEDVTHSTKDEQLLVLLACFFSTHKHTGPSTGRTKVNMCQCCLASNLSPQYEAFQHPGQLPDGSCPPLPSPHPHTECRWPLLSWPSSLNTCISYLVCNQQNSRYLFTYLLCFAGYPFPTAPPVDPFAKIKVSDCGVTKGCIRLEIHLCLSLKRARVLL